MTATKPYLATGAVTHADGKVQRIDMHLLGSSEVDANMRAELAMLKHVQQLGRSVRNMIVVDVQPVTM